MSRISPIKNSLIAEYLVKNKSIAVKDNTNPNLVRFFNQNGDYIGFLKHSFNPECSTIDISLYHKHRDNPFLKQQTTVKRKMRYFLSEKKFMPVTIDIKKSITDFEHRTVRVEGRGKGLKNDRYIEQIPEQDETLKLTREQYNIPNCNIYRINKLPFKYELKYTHYEPYKRMSEIPLEKGKEGI